MTTCHWETISLFCENQAPKSLETRFNILMKQDVYIDFFYTLSVQSTIIITPDNHGKLWSKEEEDNLMQLLSAGLSIMTIARNHLKRTLNTCITRYYLTQQRSTCKEDESVCCNICSVKVKKAYLMKKDGSTVKCCSTCRDKARKAGNDINCILDRATWHCLERDRKRDPDGPYQNAEDILPMVIQAYVKCKVYCKYCGIELYFGVQDYAHRAQLDHLVASSSTMAEGQTLKYICALCNGLKSDRDEEWLRGFLEEVRVGNEEFTPVDANGRQAH
ncbi:predicted protein [Lichtheimia corymbifera JMRC:FSU:9682]|uniref:Uncharacterized protein n=1 Tax=Lichtheimia corymbifera JMRC:FSU:9682 TaxID=1263082 RepID=A0A068RIU0_9FUNG|nr:predicted protein [Lichtheimia corymbifera JMRC:FSU:9682]